MDRHFGPEPVRARLGLGGAKVLVTTEGLYRRKVAPVRGALPSLQHVLLGGEGAPPEIAGARALEVHAQQRAAGPARAGPTPGGIS